MPDWRDEVVLAVKAWLAAEGGAGGSATWRRVGRARADGRPGWYQVDLRGGKVSEEQLERLRLAGTKAPTSGPGDGESSGFAVLDAVLDGAVLRVRVAEFVELAQPQLWTLQQPPTFLITALRDGFAALQDPGLAHVLARRELNGVRAAASASRFGGDAGLLPAQQAAYQAAMGTGVWLVWGPPGTGKTEVLRRAIGDLVAQGKRVLLVSSTNIAVDNALARVIRDQPRQPGRMVRVGTPQLAEIADNLDVALPALVRAKLAGVEAKRRQVETRLVAMRRDAEELASCETRTAGFDHAAYASARRLVGDDPDARHAELTADRDDAREQIGLWEHQARKTAADAQRTASEYAATAEARAVWQSIDALAQRNATVGAAALELAHEAVRADSDARTAADRVAAWQGQSALKRRRTRSEGESLRLHAEQSRRRAETLRLDADSARTAAESHRRQTEREIAESASSAQYSREEIARLADAARAAAQAHAQATRDRDDWIDHQRQAEQAVERFLSASATVRKAESTALPSLHERARVLRPQVAAAAALRADLERQHTQLEAEYERLARDASGEIIRQARLIATTLARFRTNQAILDGPYDAVFVDEVSSATLPEVLLAVAKADRCAVLMGDFMQLGPVGLEKLNRKVGNPLFTKWVAKDVFIHCHIASPAEALAHPKCISLDVQHRFGLDVMDLANRTAYDGLLKPGPGPKATGHGTKDDPQIVFVDTDGLGDLEQAYRRSKVSGWWAAGALLARAIAETHAELGEAVGIVTPYTPQAEATLEALLDVEASGGVLADVGTAHRFQGREFPVVVFDTVESRLSDPGWIVKASRRTNDSWAREGLRLFNVAATRTKQTLYVVASGDRVLRARDDTPLATLHAMIRAGQAIRIPASEFVTPGAEVVSEHGELAERLAQVLARHVEITDIHDEREFFNAFEPRIRTALHSIWLWAPWAAKRSRAILPLLVEAVERGVKVVVFVRGPKDNIHERDGRDLAALRAALPTVVMMHQMHQKIAVFDEQVTLYGSLNMLSQSNTRETMMTVVGAGLAKRMIAEEHARVFARPPSCAECGGREIDLRRHQGKVDGWYWRCFNPPCPALRKGQAWTQEVQL